MEKVRDKLFPNHDPYAGLELLPMNNHGWASQHAAYKEYLQIVRPNLIVEVGTWMGGSARALVKDCLDIGLTDFEVVCVDTFLGSFEHWNRSSYNSILKNGRPTTYEQFLSNTVHAGYQKYITPFPVDSQNGFLTLLGWGFKPDFVYIDAGHDYYSVKNDLTNWAGVLRTGGVIIGDDWHHGPIQKAANEVFTNGTIIDRGAKFVWIK